MNADQWFGAAIIAGAIVTIVVFRRESRLRREASPVVPLDDLLHEQDSAEAYDDLPQTVSGPDALSHLTGSIADAASHIIPAEDEGWWEIEATVRRDGDAFLVNAVYAAPVEEVDVDPEIGERKAWEDEWEERLTLDFDGGAR